MKPPGQPFPLASALLLSLALLLAAAGRARAGGLSAWYEPTPYGHELYHDGSAGGVVSLQLGTTFVSFTHFYFYRGHTIAHSADTAYYIINEATGQVQRFSAQQQWQQQLERQHLVPVLWKREYTANYSSAFGDGTLLLLLLFPVPLLLPLLWLGCFVSLAFNWGRFYRFRLYVAWLLPLLFGAIWLYNTLPQSI